MQDLIASTRECVRSDLKCAVDELLDGPADGDVAGWSKRVIHGISTFVRAADPALTYQIGKASLDDEFNDLERLVWPTPPDANWFGDLQKQQPWSSSGPHADRMRQGRQALEDWTSVDPACRRKWLANLILALSKGSNMPPLAELAEALVALDFGERRPILAPAKGLHFSATGYRRRVLQVHMYEHRCFRVAMKATTTITFDSAIAVAIAAGRRHPDSTASTEVEAQSVTKWWTALRKDLGSALLIETKARALHAAAAYTKLQAVQADGDLADDQSDHVRSIEQWYAGYRLIQLCTEYVGCLEKQKNLATTMRKVGNELQAVLGKSTNLRNERRLPL